MRYHKLDLNLLTALKALLTEKNVTRAGESVHVTQSAMSGILARLREYFGDPLIVQVGRKMELTSLAQSLVEPVNDVLLRIDATIATRPEFNPLTTSRHFSLVASDYSINVLLLDVLRRVHSEASLYPHNKCCRHSRLRGRRAMRASVPTFGPRSREKALPESMSPRVSELD